MEIDIFKSSDLANVRGLNHEQTILVLPFIDNNLAAKTADVLNRRALNEGLLVLVEDDLRIGFIKVANMIFSRSDSLYFGYLAQDAYPGEGWLRCGINVLNKSGANPLSFNDGRFYGNIAVFGLARRTWVQSIYRNCIFYPGYISHFGDTELSVLALSSQSLVFNPNCLLIEVDYEKHFHGNNPKDDALYRERARTGFNGLVDPFEPD